ncbi:1-acyl-sn-glycerol-3-phosphate acyltransferase [Candidatus Babeliales bacterium]|nr:1-acyl-sn-glycerol-3-phosphate acyltransferase [Candidatus Babeliales bacterium]MCF7899733.1 1-acyl-sn-glycerol-3-phosphate acyltransferase [Candidatus Babeliales bacterium]
MRLFLRTIRTYTLFLFVSLIFSSLCVPLTFLPKRIRYKNKFYFFLTYLWSKILLLTSFTRIKIEGKQNLVKYLKEPAIFVMNHVSFLDILLTEIILKNRPHVWISKKELGSIPVLRILLKRMHVLVQRESSGMAARALVKAYNLAKTHKSHILLFPEGTRYADGQIHEFLNGFAVLSKKLNRQVYPIAILGVHKVLPKKSFIFNSKGNEIRLVIGEPFSYIDNESEEEFTKRVHDWFKKCMS